MKKLILIPMRLFVPEKVGAEKEQLSWLEKRKEKVERIYQSALFECDHLTSRRAWNLKARIETEILIRNSY